MRSPLEKFITGSSGLMIIDHSLCAKMNTTDTSFRFEMHDARQGEIDTCEVLNLMTNFGIETEYFHLNL